MPLQLRNVTNKFEGCPKVVIARYLSKHVGSIAGTILDYVTDKFPLEAMPNCWDTDE